MADDPKRPPSKDREQAIALKYLDSSSLPTILAKGHGEIAREIIKLANDHNIPVTKDEGLSSILAKVQTDDAIPEEAFRLVAEVLCWLYYSDKEWREKHAHLKSALELPNEDLDIAAQDISSKNVKK